MDCFEGRSSAPYPPCIILRCFQRCCRQYYYQRGFHWRFMWPSPPCTYIAASSKPREILWIGDHHGYRWHRHFTARSGNRMFGFDNMPSLHRRKYVRHPLFRICNGNRRSTWSWILIPWKRKMVPLRVHEWYGAFGLFGYHRLAIPPNTEVTGKTQFKINGFDIQKASRTDAFFISLSRSCRTCSLMRSLTSLNSQDSIFRGSGIFQSKNCLAGIQGQASQP